LLSAGGTDARRAAEELREELGATYRSVRGHGCLEKQIKPAIADARRAAEELREEHGVTYGGVRGHGYLKKLFAKGHGD